MRLEPLEGGPPKNPGVQWHQEQAQATRSGREAEVCKEGLIRGREETGSHKILEYYFIYIYGESSLYL